MKHRRVWVSTDLFAHPDECREAESWCGVCNCCMHCFHECSCEECGCVNNSPAEPQLFVTVDES